MNEIPEDVMKAAREARMDGLNNERLFLDNPHISAIARAILAERERCAKVAVDAHNEWVGDAELLEKDGRYNASKKSIAMARGAALIAGRINNS